MLIEDEGEHIHMHTRMHASLLSETQDNHLPNKELFVWILFPGLKAFIYKWLVQLMSNTLINCTSEVWPKTYTASYNFQSPLGLSFWSVDWVIGTDGISLCIWSLFTSFSFCCLSCHQSWVDFTPCLCLHEGSLNFWALNSDPHLDCDTNWWQRTQTL